MSSSATLGGYAFARLRFPLREPLFMLVLATLMIPDQMRLVPVFQILADFPLFHWNLITTYQGYILIIAVRDEPLPDAAVLPHDPEGLRGGGEASTPRASSRRTGA